MLQENKARISLDHSLLPVRQYKYHWPWCKESVKLCVCAANWSLADETTFTLWGQYSISHLTFCAPFPLGSHCWWWSVSNVKLTAPGIYAGDQGKPLLSSTAPDFFQICLPLTCFLSKTHLPKPSIHQIYGCTHPAAWNCLTLSLSLWLYTPRQAWESTAQAAPHLRWH